MVVGVDDESIFLMIIPKKNLLFPVCGAAFSYSQNSNKNLSDTAGAILIESNGSFYKIDSVRKVGLWGKGFKEKFKSCLFGMYEISVELSVLDVSLKYFKKQLVECVKIDMESPDPLFSYPVKDVNAIESAIIKCNSSRDLFFLLGVNSVEDCIDSL